jgi:hypothetical protein
VLLPLRLEQPERPVHHHNSESGERKIKPEDHRPVKMLGQQSTETGTSHAGKRPNPGKIALIFGAFAGSNDVSNNCQCERN